MDIFEKINGDVDHEDDYYGHFHALSAENGSLDWIDYADHGVSLINFLYSAIPGEEIEEGSRVDSVIHAVAAESENNAIRRIAKLLGLDPEEFSFAVATLLEAGGTVDFQRVTEECAAAREFFHSLKTRKCSG